MYLLVLMTEHF